MPVRTESSPKPEVKRNLIPAVVLSEKDSDALLKLPEGSTVVLDLGERRPSFSNGVLRSVQNQLTSENLLSTASAALSASIAQPLVKGLGCSAGLYLGKTPQAFEFGCKAGASVIPSLALIYTGYKLTSVGHSLIKAELSSELEGSKWKQYAGEELASLVGTAIFGGLIRGVVRRVEGKLIVDLSKPSSAPASGQRLEYLGVQSDGRKLYGLSRQENPNSEALSLPTPQPLSAPVLKNSLFFPPVSFREPRFLGYPDEFEGRSPPSSPPLEQTASRIASDTISKFPACDDSSKKAFYSTTLFVKPNSNLESPRAQILLQIGKLLGSIGVSQSLASDPEIVRSTLGMNNELVERLISGGRLLIRERDNIIKNIREYKERNKDTSPINVALIQDLEISTKLQANWMNNVDGWATTESGRKVIALAWLLFEKGKLIFSETHIPGVSYPLLSGLSKVLEIDFTRNRKKALGGEPFLSETQFEYTVSKIRAIGGESLASKARLLLGGLVEKKVEQKAAVDAAPPVGVDLSRVPLRRVEYRPEVLLGFSSKNSAEASITPDLSYLKSVYGDRSMVEKNISFVSDDQVRRKAIIKLAKFIANDNSSEAYHVSEIASVLRVPEQEIVMAISSRPPTEALRAWKNSSQFIERYGSHPDLSYAFRTAEILERGLWNPLNPIDGLSATPILRPFADLMLFLNRKGPDKLIAPRLLANKLREISQIEFPFDGVPRSDSPAEIARAESVQHAYSAKLLTHLRSLFTNEPDPLTLGKVKEKIAEHTNLQIINQTNLADRQLNSKIQADWKDKPLRQHLESYLELATKESSDSLKGLLALTKSLAPPDWEDKVTLGEFLSLVSRDRSDIDSPHADILRVFKAFSPKLADAKAAIAKYTGNGALQQSIYAAVSDYVHEALLKEQLTVERIFPRTDQRISYGIASNVDDRRVTQLHEIFNVRENVRVPLGAREQVLERVQKKPHLDWAVKIYYPELFTVSKK